MDSGAKKSGTLREAVRAIYKDAPMTDRELVLDAKEEIAEALAKETKLKDIYPVMRDWGFKGDIRKFTEILQEFGLWKIRVGHRKSPDEPQSNFSALQKAASAAQPAAPSGRKIWGGRNNNPTPPPVDNIKTNTEKPAGATMQEDLEKIFGKAAFW